MFFVSPAGSFLWGMSEGLGGENCFQVFYENH